MIVFRSYKISNKLPEGRENGTKYILKLPCPGLISLEEYIDLDNKCKRKLEVRFSQGSDF